MEKSQNIVKSVGVTLLILVALGYAAIENSIEEISNFRCTGNLKNKPAIIYVRMEVYRWYAGLWHGTDGSVHVEVPNEYSYRRGSIKNYGDSIAVCWSDGSVCGLLGFYSRQTGEITLNSLKGSFSGECRKIHR